MKLNLNYISLAILVVAYALSTGRFFHVSSTLNTDADVTDTSKKILRVAHWQLEPGYREGLQVAIDAYNELPHVKAANLTVEQMPITQRVYSQFMNVHMISGTAPDIAVNGKSRLIRGSSLSKFYTPISDYISEPNPYNSREYTSEELPDDIRIYLENAPWKDTFVDGMIGGYEQSLDNYFGVPVSIWGATRFFYNTELVKDAKESILAALNEDVQPDWLQACWYDGHRNGYLYDTPELREWLNTPNIPETLGQLMLLLNGFQSIIDASGSKRTVAITVRGDSFDISTLYEFSFMHSMAKETFSLFPGAYGSIRNALEALRMDKWDFDTPAVREFYQFAEDVSNFYPVGYLGLDRDQSQRRFILGDALLYAAGGWEASAIFSGVQSRDNPEDRFEINIAPNPLPKSGERWSEFVTMRQSEAQIRGGVPMAINQATPLFNEALDFLRFISSQPINEKFNKKATWMPVAVGAEAVDQMKPFKNLTGGVPPRQSIRMDGGSLSGLPSQMRLPIIGSKNLLKAKQIDYETFSETVTDIVKHPTLGMDAFWVEDLTRKKNYSRSLDRVSSAVAYDLIFHDNEEERKSYAKKLFFSLDKDSGFNVQRDWYLISKGKPFPTTRGN